LINHRRDTGLCLVGGNRPLIHLLDELGQVTARIRRLDEHVVECVHERAH
jgi:hypothetical protein